jgi:CTP:molybdopterin cytidylyltransferase MocA
MSPPRPALPPDPQRAGSVRAAEPRAAVARPAHLPGTGELAGLVLAAGGGSRLGQPKALLRLAGELLVERACRLLVDGGCGPLVVVLGAAAADVLEVARLPAGAIVVHNPDWPTGMASSLRAGLAALPAEAGAVVIGLVDQPLVHPEAVRRLAAAWRSGALAAVASYRGEPRNPVLLARPVLAEVAATATGDRGARGWLRGHPDQTRLVPCDDAGDPADIDTPDDLAAVTAKTVPTAPRPPAGASVQRSDRAAR